MHHHSSLYNVDRKRAITTTTKGKKNKERGGKELIKIKVEINKIENKNRTAVQ